LSSSGSECEGVIDKDPAAAERRVARATVIIISRELDSLVDRKTDVLYNVVAIVISKKNHFFLVQIIINNNHDSMVKQK